jgi:hypothetical protein
VNIRIELDAGAVEVRWTNEEPDGEFVFATLTEAKERAVRGAVSEREAWATCVRQARGLTRADIAPPWPGQGG